MLDSKANWIMIYQIYLEQITEDKEEKFTPVHNEGTYLLKFGINVFQKLLSRGTNKFGTVQNFFSL